MRQNHSRVVGGSNPKFDPAISRLATQLGAALTQADAIVLTGGKGGGGTTVKDAAVDGAVGGRIISIVKNVQGITLAEKHLVVGSGMQDARNVLNGFTPDVLIALWGGSGTLTEIAFAAIAGRPVIFLHSRTYLATHIDGMADIAGQAVTAFSGRRYTERNLKRVVLPLLKAQTNDARTIDEAVARALDVPLTGMLPDIPSQPNARAEYIKKLTELDS